jgi:hypothetical protein
MRHRNPTAIKRLKPTRVARQTLALFTALAFFMQAIITQTHIHGAQTQLNRGLEALLLKIAETGDADQGGGAHKSGPSKSDESRCAFCQAAQSSGSFTIPPAVLIAVPVALLALDVVVPVLGSLSDTASHHWRGRAPPST